MPERRVSRKMDHNVEKNGFWFVGGGGSDSNPIVGVVIFPTVGVVIFCHKPVVRTGSKRLLIFWLCHVNISIINLIAVLYGV